ncbi:UNVERIFIED_CONTAM: hypothetical protein Slati_2172800 [Sesamum latifolium]|uniref:CCHC-type domain-containing protein n=1 Tax=Sesamum latifolium TaxID=2727402 RepID=A0AAW2WTA4_9LAMI
MRPLKVKRTRIDRYEANVKPRSRQRERRREKGDEGSNQLRVDEIARVEGTKGIRSQKSIFRIYVQVRCTSISIGVNFTFISNLPLSKMNLRIASFIGNSIEKFRDLEMEDSGRAWGSSLRIRVALNFTQPLIRALSVCASMGDELVVSFTYERLQNFCYLCGRLGHIDTYCELRFKEGFQDPGQGMPYGAWLRAPPSSWGTQKTVAYELEEFLSHEEILWKQRGKAQWLADGDRNTPYFHARASARRRKNFISRLRDKNGEWCATYEGIQQIIPSYFVDLFQMSSPSEEVMEGVIGGMPARVSEHMNDTLIQPFSGDEVNLAISQMYPYKSPSPDGMSPVFYQKYWHIVGSEVTSFVLDFLNHRQFDTTFNYTYIVLNPKCASPENMSHFRRISLCNITYKIGSKMIANRLKLLPLTIVFESQSAFIPGRLITDNVLVAYELNHYLAHKTWGRRVMQPLRWISTKLTTPWSGLFL